MNHHENLREALSHRSGDAMADSELDFDRVHAQARGIRRRRRVGTGVAAAAVLAVVAVPTALVLGDQADRSAPGPAEQTSQAPDQRTDAPTDPETDTAPDSSGEDLAEDKEAAAQHLEALPTTDELSVEYLLDGRVHLFDGSTIDGPPTQAPIVALSSFKGGWLVATQDNPGNRGDAMIRRFDSGGTEVDAVPGTGTFATTSDGTQLAWWTWNEDTGTGELHATGISSMGEGLGPVQDTGDASYVVPVGWIGTGEVVYQATVEGVGPSVRATDLAGEVRSIDTLGQVAGTDQVNDRIAGQAPGDGLTGRVVDGTTGEEMWSKEGYRLGRFSPDGRYVIGYPAQVDPTPIVILDAADGAVVAEVDLLPDHGLGHTEVHWNDDESLVVEAYVWAGTGAEDHPGALLRFGTDGTLERASDVGTGDWVFLPRP